MQTKPAAEALPLPDRASARWSRDVSRIDIGPGYRLTPHTQIKLQFSVERQDADIEPWSEIVAVQFTTRF